MTWRTLITVAVLLAPAGCDGAPDAPPRSRRPEGASAPLAAPEPPALRAFRYHAGAPALSLRDLAGRATMTDGQRDELLRLIDAHLRRVDDALARHPLGDADVDAAMQRGSALNEMFNVELAAWGEKYPAAAKALQRQANIREAYATALTHQPSAVVRAARAAGLPRARAAEARKAVEQRRQRLLAALEETNQRIAAAPPDEAEALDDASDGDLQMERVNAARDLRDAIERMLPRPADRGKLDDAILKWFTDFEPGEAEETALLRDARPVRCCARV